MPPTVPGFEGLEEIGRGGFAVVYRAWQSAFDRQAALKVLTVLDLDDRARRRFERECRSAGRLSWHPHIVVVFDAGATDEGRPYLAMEYLEDGSLADRLERDGPLPRQGAVASGIQLAGALQTAHEHGVLHRDVKPENVLVDRFGRAKLADFGIAGVLGGTRTRTESTTATVVHAAPEILEGEQASAASDVYSLGSCLFTLLTGRAAFAKETDESVLAIMRRIAEDPVPDLRREGVPAPLASVIESAMAKGSNARPATAEDLGRALQEVQRQLGDPVTELPIAGGAEASPTPSTPTVTVAGPPPAEPAGQAVRDAPKPLGDPVTGRADAARTPSTLSVGEAPPAEPGVPATARPRRRGRVIAAVALVGALVLAGAIGVVAVTGGGDPTRRLAVSATVDVGPAPLGVAVGQGAVWVGNYDGATVSRIDPGADAVTATIDVGSIPESVVVWEGSVWVANFDAGTVSRIDPGTDAVTATIDVGSRPAGVAVGWGAVWVANSGDDTASRIERGSDAVTATIDVGSRPGDVAVGEGAVWVTNILDNTVSRIDPAADAVTATIAVGGNPDGVAVGEGAVWVTNSDDGTVSRIDPATDTATATIAVGSRTTGVAVGDGAVWVAHPDDNTVSRIDPDSNTVTATIAVGANPGDVAVGEGAVWVTNFDDDTVSRIE